MEIFNKFIKLIEYKAPSKYHFVLPESNPDKTSRGANDLEGTKNDALTENVFPSIDVNKECIKNKYSFDINSDIKLREFTINVKGKQYKAFLFYIEGMIDGDSINDFVIRPLMLKNMTNLSDNDEDTVRTAITNNVTVRRVKKFDLKNYILESLIPQNDVSTETKFKSIIQKVNAGVSALFIDTIDCAFMIDAKGFEKRSVSPPDNENIIRGSQEGFIESLRTNTTLLRRIINSENLIIEELNVGKISNTQVAVCYLKNVANDKLVKEVMYRIDNIGIDYLLSSGQLEQLIEDTNFSVPQLLSTERPDRLCSYILEGRVAILVNGTPYGLVVPAVFIDFLSSAEDRNLKYQFANLLKAVRILAFFITLLLPGLYIAVTAFHQELVPTELLFAIVASRSNVPFPIIFEILMMEISLELIRESGVRVPAPLGQAIGIVGAIILGDASVSANIVSPILVIIVAITGITAFAIPDFSMSFHVRIARFIYIISGYLAGFLGIAFCFVAHITILASISSFGVSYLSPYAPVSKDNASRYFLSPLWKREKRRNYLNTKRPIKEDKISRQWKY